METGECLGRSCRFRVSRTSWAAQAERKVQCILEQLPMDHFIVMNDIKFRYGNIDHLVIRDDGAIFLIETKSHRGVITSDGNQLLLNGKPFKKNPICQVNRTIRWLRNMIARFYRRNVWIVAVLVFPRAKVNCRKIIKRVNMSGEDDVLAILHL